MTKADGAAAETVLFAQGDFGLSMKKPEESRRPNERADEKSFWYDHVFTGAQDEVYDCVGRPMLQDALEGYNVTLFAYGQTGSGKTFSIQGPAGKGIVDDDFAGLVPRFCKDLLSVAQESLEMDATLSIKIALSMIEIYNEKVRDLLETRKSKNDPLSDLEIHETKDKKIYVEGLSLHTVTNYNRFVSLMQRGLANRQVSETNMNEHSSRSHSILQIYLAQTHDPPRPDAKDVESVINIVDLAGSERQGKTQSTGERFEESKKINHSLMMLGRALNTFSDGKAEYVPLRESKLTRLLSESFGGNARTWMLACVSPSAYNYHESMSTLQYAQNAKAIVNKAKVNAMQEKLELKQLQQKYGSLEKLFDAEREKTRQLQLELQQRGEVIHQLQTELAESKAVSSCPDNLPPLLPLRNPNMFIGRAHLSLKNIIELNSNYVTLPLITDREDCDGAILMVSTYPLRKIKAQGDEVVKVRDLLGKRMDLVVHVIGAKNIPAQYTSSVYCKYVFRHAEKDVYQTRELPGPNPEFDYKKRFAFGSLTQQLVDYLASANVLTFEVLGQGKQAAYLAWSPKTPPAVEASDG
uniref:Kinesin-like protein n=1 Tax=Eutreptiella gymnastica TaxID=73025 RepID=A0A7S1N5X8_9EUGL